MSLLYAFALVFYLSRLNPCLSAINYVPYTQDIRNIYVRYTQDNRVVNLRIPYLPPAFCLLLSAFFLETTSLPFQYHSITTVLPSSTFPAISFGYLYMLFIPPPKKNSPRKSNDLQGELIMLSISHLALIVHYIHQHNLHLYSC